MAPADLKEFSPNHQFFLLSKIKENRTEIFRTNKSSVQLWEIPTYIQIPSLSNDGNHVASSYAGGNILDRDVRPSDPLITFYNSSGTKRVVLVEEVVGDPQKLPKSTSGIPWGRVIGFQSTGRLTVILESGKTLTLDPELHP